MIQRLSDEEYGCIYRSNRGSSHLFCVSTTTAYRFKILTLQLFLILIILLLLSLSLLFVLLLNEVLDSFTVSLSR